MQESEVAKRWLGINWQISPTSGWGILGTNIALQAEADGRFLPVPTVKSILSDAMAPQYLGPMKRIVARERFFEQLQSAHPGQPCHCRFPVLHALGNRLASTDPAERVIGDTNAAIVFFEDTDFPDSAREVAARFNWILGGSSWNAWLLRKRGFSNVVVWLQGVDLSLFRPKRRLSSTAARFVIFSGGKLEFRKGQDIVIAAFRQFRRRHPDALLVTAWHNHWPKTVQGVCLRGHVSGVPEVDSQNCLRLRPWLEANGIPPGSTHHVDAVPNHLLPDLYAQIDVAVFANRCEGGTNLSAMECLASGIPTILSANTGHLDLIDSAHCYPLLRQSKVEPVAPFRGTDGWGESDVDEIVETLERVYADRQEAQRRAESAVRFMESWSWQNRYQELLRILSAQ